MIAASRLQAKVRTKSQGLPDVQDKIKPVGYDMSDHMHNIQEVI